MGLRPVDKDYGPYNVTHRLDKTLAVLAGGDIVNDEFVRACTVTGMS